MLLRREYIVDVMRERNQQQMLANAGSSCRSGFLKKALLVGQAALTLSQNSVTMADKIGIK